MKKFFGSLALAGALVIGAMNAHALPGGGGGGGLGGVDCSVCVSRGGWGPGPVRSSCEGTMSPSGGGGCQVNPSGLGCTFNGGCVSVPDDWRKGVAL